MNIPYEPRTPDFYLIWRTVYRVTRSVNENILVLCRPLPLGLCVLTSVRLLLGNLYFRKFNKACGITTQSVTPSRFQLSNQNPPFTLPVIGRRLPDYSDQTEPVFCLGYGLWPSSRLWRLDGYRGGWMMMVGIGDLHPNVSPNLLFRTFCLSLSPPLSVHRWGTHLVVVYCLEFSPVFFPECRTTPGDIPGESNLHFLTCYC
jgi:hypothetical protein